jgi:hypothetical protein
MDVKKENLDRDWTKLESYAGLTPEEVIEMGRTHIHLLVLGKEEMGADIARTFQGEDGDEAGLASICAILFLKKYGARTTASVASDMYLEIAKENKNDSLLERVRNMQGMFYFSVGYKKNLEWPVKFPFKETGHRAGLANIMLGISIGELAEGSNVDVIAANGIVNFMDEGFLKRATQKIKRKLKK